MTDSNSIDWELLRNQKADLVESMMSNETPSEATMTGLVNLIDNIQDEAVDSGVMSEEAVFG